MKLINTSTLELHDFCLAEIPPYVILSHTWSDGEVTFQEMSSKNSSSKKTGFAKIAQTCKIALMDGLEYAWVDTCCIDKSSSAELSEAINSMYQWYANAAFCYVYLEDLPHDRIAEEALPSCRWFTRGWTLQELLAPNTPSNVHFYDKDWFYRGSKVDFVKVISECTRVPRKVLTGDYAIAKYSVAARMSWAARRRTTRLEDSAYCLLGIFDVNMPLLYGEGGKAFRRLQEEIIKRHNDLTIFAWEAPRSPSTGFLGLFAETPEAFTHSSMIHSFFNEFVEFSVTNKGLRISGDVPLSIVCRKGRDQFLYALFVGLRSPSTVNGGIYLRKLGPNLFYRDTLPDGTSPLAGFGDPEFIETRAQEEPTEFYVLTDQNQKVSIQAFLEYALHVPQGGFRIQNAVPQTLWDVTTRVFLRPKPPANSRARYPTLVAIDFDCMLDNQHLALMLLCDYRTRVHNPACRLFFSGSHPRAERMLFGERNRNEYIYWSQFEFDFPEIMRQSNTIESTRGENHVRISAWFETKKVKVDMNTQEEDVEMFSLKLDITVKDKSGRVRRY